MKLQHSLLAAALLAAVSTSAVAQSSGVVTLGGTIVPSSCALQFNGSDTANVGQVDYSTLSQTGMTMQASINMTLEIDCTGPTLLAVTLEDNRAGTAEGTFNNQLGLGTTTTGKKIGRVGFVANTPIVDGSAGNLIQSTNLSTWTNAGLSYWDKKGVSGNVYRAFGTTSGPTPLTDASMGIRVDANLNSRNNLQLTQDEAIDGLATIEIHYL